MKFVKYILLIFVLLLTISQFACTENQRAKNFGGDFTLNLPKGQKLVTITWKDDNLWYLTRPMHEDEKAETYSFQESSSFGMMNGTVTIEESK